MPQNQIEILIAAKDQASQQIQQLNQQLAQVDKAAKGAGQGLASAGAQSLSATQQFSALSSSTRFAAASVLTELNPALGLAVTRMSSLSTVAGTTGSLLKGTLVVGGIALAATALGSWIRRTNEQIEAQQKLNRQVASFDVAGIQGSVAALSAEIDLAIAKQQTFFGVVIPFWQEVAKSIFGTSTSLDLLKQRLEAAREAFDKVRPKQFQEELAGEQAQREKLLQTIHQQTLATSENIEEIRRAGAALEESSDLEAKFQARRLEITAKGAIEKAREEGLGQAEIERLELLHAQQRENLLLQFGNRKVEIVRQTNERVKALVDEAEKEAEAKAEEGARRAGERIDKIFDAIKKQQEQVERIMTSLGNAAADALFDGLIGRSRSLGEAFKSFFEGLARDIFRNTLTTLVGGKTQGLSLQNLFSLGRSRPGFSPAPLAAVLPGMGGIPGIGPGAGVMPGVDGVAGVQTAAQVAAAFGFAGAGGFAPGTAALQEARGLGGVLADGGGGLTFAQGLGGALGIAGGALALASTAQMTSPLLGGLVGGLGGLSIAGGALTLFGTAATATAPAALFGLGAGALGAIGFGVGAVIGIGLSIAASQRAKKKRRSAEQASQNAQLGEQRIAELEALLGTPQGVGALAEHPFVVELLLDVGRVMRFQGSTNTDNARVQPFRFFLDAAVGAANRFVAGTASLETVVGTVHGSFNRGEVDQFPMSASLSASGARWIQQLLSQGVAGFLAAEARAFETGEGLPEGFEPPQAMGGFLIQEALLGGRDITRFEALADVGPRQRRQAIAAIQRGALVSLFSAAGPEELEFIIARIRETSELMGLPVLGQARFVELLG